MSLFTRNYPRSLFKESSISITVSFIWFFGEWHSATTGIFKRNPFVSVPRSSWTRPCPTKSVAIYESTSRSRYLAPEDYLERMSLSSAKPMVTVPCSSLRDRHWFPVEQPSFVCLPPCNFSVTLSLSLSHEKYWEYVWRLLVFRRSRADLISHRLISISWRQLLDRVVFEIVQRVTTTD